MENLNCLKLHVSRNASIEFVLYYIIKNTLRDTQTQNTRSFSHGNWKPVQTCSLDASYWDVFLIYR